VSWFRSVSLPLRSPDKLPLDRPRLGQVPLLPLEERGFCGHATKRRQVLQAQPARQHSQDVRVPVWAVVIMLRRHERHRLLKTLLQIQHGLFNDLAQMQVPLGILRSRIWADHQPIEHTPLPCLVDQLICLD
jgi:hypothetical protein